MDTAKLTKAVLPVLKRRFLRNVEAKVVKGTKGKPTVVMVKIPSMGGSELEHFASLADEYCTTDRIPPNESNFKLDGKNWILGDGDDSSAVMYNQGSMIIWLRQID